jgi:hypothetical protein
MAAMHPGHDLRTRVFCLFYAQKKNLYFFFAAKIPSRRWITAAPAIEVISA